MTALCGGGTSGPQAGTTLAVDFTISAISVALAEYGASWAIKAIPFVTSLPSFVLSSFCGTDPPAVPTFTAAEANAILQLSFTSDFFSGISKMVDLISHVMWYQVCTCTSGTLTALPAAAPPPTGTAVPTDTPLPLNPNCQGLKSSFPGNGPWTDDPSQYSTAYINQFGSGSGNPWSYIWFPTSVPTSFRATLYNNTHTAPGVTIPMSVRQTATYNGTSIGTDSTVNLAPNTHVQFNMTPRTGAQYLMLNFGATTGTGTADVIGSSMEAFCGGDAPGGTIQPCCPPDAATQATLDAILSLTTLIQRQLAPFATVHGTAHTGLSGTGQFAVQGILGLAVDVTTAPPRLGTVFGDPTSIFGAGWITVGTADGWSSRAFITSDPFLLQPVAPNVTLVGYSIPADVTVTITEIVREAS